MSLRAWVRVDDDELRRWCSDVLDARGHVVDAGVVPGGAVDVVVCDAGHAKDVENGVYGVGARVVVVVDQADDATRRRLRSAGTELVERATANPHLLVDVLERTPAHGTPGLEDALAELRAHFAAEVPKRVAAIVAALDGVIAGGDDVEVARAAAVRAAHVLYGTAGSFGFPELSQACRNVELTLTAQLEKQEPTTPAAAQALKATLSAWTS